jgi:hypothetical protein
MGWIGYFQCNARSVTDISKSCLKRVVAIRLADVAQEREAEGDLVLGDIGYGMPFRAGSFDGAIRLPIFRL